MVSVCHWATYTDAGVGLSQQWTVQQSRNDSRTQGRRRQPALELWVGDCLGTQEVADGAWCPDWGRNPRRQEQ